MGFLYFSILMLHLYQNIIRFGLHFLKYMILKFKHLANEFWLGQILFCHTPKHTSYILYYILMKNGILVLTIIKAKYQHSEKH